MRREFSSDRRQRCGVVSEMKKTLIALRFRPSLKSPGAQAPYPDANPY
jgi:hypothetical protein